MWSSNSEGDNKESSLQSMAHCQLLTSYRTVEGARYLHLYRNLRGDLGYIEEKSASSSETQSFLPTKTHLNQSQDLQSRIWLEEKM